MRVTYSEWKSGDLRIAKDNDIGGVNFYLIRSDYEKSTFHMHLDHKEAVELFTALQEVLGVACEHLPPVPDQS